MMRRDDTRRDGLPVPAAADAPNLLEAFLARWRTFGVPTLQWALVGSIMGSAWTLQAVKGVIEQHGYLLWLYRGTAPAFVSALILLVSFGLSAGSGSELARRPGRYLLVLALASAIATAAIWAIDWSLAVKHTFPLPNRLMDNWLTVMLFGGAFGWAAVLNVKRSEEQAALTQLLMRRSLLARQVAQAKLFAARAQIDPDMVARELSRVRDLYPADAEGAGALLDQLIDHLRLAMNRMGTQRAAGAGEVDILHHLNESGAHRCT